MKRFISLFLLSLGIVTITVSGKSSSSNLYSRVELRDSAKIDRLNILSLVGDSSLKLAKETTIVNLKMKESTLMADSVIRLLTEIRCKQISNKDKQRDN